MNKFMCILWLIVGVAILASGEEITKLQYACCWIVLMCKYVVAICEEET